MTEMKRGAGDGSWFLFIFALFMSQGSALGDCPWDEEGLSLWSDPVTWPGKAVPVENDTVHIGAGVSVLLDISPPPLDGVTISGDGRLIWGVNQADIELRAYSVLVNDHASLIIGSAVCKYPVSNKATITLRGKRDERPDVESFGQKFLGVQHNGTLEIHGADKIAWTKLSQNVVKPIKTSEGLIFSHDVGGNWTEVKNGIYFYLFNFKSLELIPLTRNVFNSKKRSHIEEELPAIINGMTPSQIAMMSVRGEVVKAGSGIDVTPLMDALSARGITQLKDFEEGDAFAAIFFKDNSNSNSNVQELAKMRGHVYTETNVLSVVKRKCTYMVQSGNIVKHQPKKISKHRRKYVRFQVVDNNVYEGEKLSLVDDVSSWQPGDQIVVSSTDYDWTQAEVRTISSVKAGGYQIELTSPLWYGHYGEIYQNVDERAEVGLLTRNVLIRGERESRCYGDNHCDVFDLDIFGGHLKINLNFNSVNIEGAEFDHMGQHAVLGTYPIHFHMCLERNATPGKAAPYIKQNSIHHAASRCVTIHATHGIQVIDNMAYLHVGHCYFLEDGGERRNVFDGNLGIGTLKGVLSPTDVKPSTFWIKSPDTYLRNNVAGGSESMGFWMIFPDRPNGLSADLDPPLWEEGEASRFPIPQFENCVAHSNQRGIFMDNKVGADDTLLSVGNQYRPTSEVVFSYVTAYKNWFQNMWLRGSPLTCDHCSLADSPRGITYAVAAGFLTYVNNSVIIGESDNTGEPEVMQVRGTGGAKTYQRFEKSFPNYRNLDTAFTGFLIYDVTQHVRNTYFDGYYSDDFKHAGAIGWHRNTDAISMTINSAANLSFGFDDDTNTESNMVGNRVFDGDGSGEFGADFGDRLGDKSAIVYDHDGSLTGHAGANVVKPRWFYNTHNCFNRTNWNMAVCPEKFAKVRVKGKLHGSSQPVNLYAVRDDFHVHKEELLTEKTDVTHFLMIDNYNYTAHFVNGIPDELELILDGFEKNVQKIRLGLCFANDTTGFTIFYDDTPIELAESFAAFEEASFSNPYTAFWEVQTGLLFLSLQGIEERAEGDWYACPNTGNAFKCPTITITRTGGGEFADCYSNAYGPYISTTPPADDRALTAPQILASSSLPADFGAGSTLPFSVRTNP